MTHCKFSIVHLINKTKFKIVQKVYLKRTCTKAFQVKYINQLIYQCTNHFKQPYLYADTDNTFAGTRKRLNYSKLDGRSI